MFENKKIKIFLITLNIILAITTLLIYLNNNWSDGWDFGFGLLISYFFIFILLVITTINIVKLRRNKENKLIILVFLFIFILQYPLLKEIYIKTINNIDRSDSIIKKLNKEEYTFTIADEASEKNLVFELKENKERYKIKSGISGFYPFFNSVINISLEEIFHQEKKLTFVPITGFEVGATSYKDYDNSIILSNVDISLNNKTLFELIYDYIMQSDKITKKNKTITLNDLIYNYTNKEFEGSFEGYITLGKINSKQTILYSYITQCLDKENKRIICSSLIFPPFDNPPYKGQLEITYNEDGKNIYIYKIRLLDPYPQALEFVGKYGFE